MNTPTGFTAQYITVATALSMAWQDYHWFKEDVLRDGQVALESLDGTSARRITIVVLSAALCESVANTYFSMKFDAESWALLEKTSPVEKWRSMPRLLHHTYSFPRDSVLGEDLTMLYRCRNAVMHSKPEVYAGDEKLHLGNVDAWSSVDQYADRFYDVALRLLDHLEKFDHMGVVIHSSSIRAYLLPARPRPPKGEGHRLWRLGKE